METRLFHILFRVKELISSPNIPEEDKATIHIMRAIFLFILCGLIVLWFVNLSWKQDWISVALPFLFVVFIGIWVGMERGHVQVSMFLLAIVMDGIATYGGTFGNGLHDIVIVIFPGTIIITSLILNRKLMFLLITATIAMVGWLGYSETIPSIPRMPLIPGNLGDFVFVSLVILGASLWAMLISEQNQRNLRRIQYNATHDYLTGCPNRVLLFDRIDQIIRQQQRNPRQNYAVLYIDLDGFKDVNDNFGHRRGDELIVAVAHRIQVILRNTDTIARLGGDEFILLLPQLNSQDDALQVADRVLQEIQAPFDLTDTRVSISASIGIVFGADYISADDLIMDADLAMYYSKKMGKDQRQVFEHSMRSLVDETIGAHCAKAG